MEALPIFSAAHDADRPASFSLVLILAFLAASAGSCQSTPSDPAPLVPPPVMTVVHYFPGSPLAGPSKVGALPRDPGEALKVQVDIIALATLPEDALEPLSSNARLIWAARGETPVLAAPNLSLGSRVGILEDANRFIHRLRAGAFGESAPVVSMTGAVPPGVTAVFRASAELPLRHPIHGDPLEKRVEIQVHHGLPETSTGDIPSNRDAPVIQVVLVMEDLAYLDTGERDQDRSLQEEATPEGRSSPRTLAKDRPVVLQREGVLLDPCPGIGCDPIALVIPSPFDGSRARALAAVVQAASPSAGGNPLEADFLEAFANCLVDLGAWIESGPSHHPESAGNTVWPGLKNLLGGCAIPSKCRGTILYFAGATGARMAEDLALSASDSLLRVLAETVLEEAGGREIQQDPDIAWILEQSAVKLLIGLQAHHELTPQLEGILSVHTGEVGRHPNILEEVFKESENLDAFHRFLEEGNKVYLEDNFPAARTRAFDWLTTRNQVPAGYDPLASVKERRAALAGAAAEPNEEGNQEQHHER